MEMTEAARKVRNRMVEQLADTVEDLFEALDERQKKKGLAMCRRARALLGEIEILFLREDDEASP
jgi:hypothetical protein